MAATDGNAAQPRRIPVARIAGNISMAVSTATRSLGDDPLTFVIQLGRRFPRARRPLAVLALAARGDERELARLWLSGDLAATRTTLEDVAARGPLGRLGTEIAHAAGRPELVVDDPRAHPVVRARAAWLLGEASYALSLLESAGSGSRLRRTLRAELALMTPGTRLQWSRPGAAQSSRGSGVLHLLTNSLPHTQSGYTVRSHAVLTAQREAGLSPTAMTRVGYPVVVGGIGAASSDVIDGIRYHRALPDRLAATPDGRLVQQADALAALAEQVRPAALQTTTHYPNAIVVRAVAEALELPWAYEVRGMLEQTWVASLGSDAARDRALSSERFRLTREREAELASAADLVFTLSDGMRDDLAERGVPRERIELVPNGIDAALLDRARSEPREARRALGLETAGFWVGSTSSLVDYEGFDVLLDAVRIARDRGHDVRALLVGEGAARRGLETQARESGLSDAAVFTGRVPREAVAEHRDALDLFVVPRHDRAVTRTVSPLKPIEAMASGTPLVVSGLPPLTETIGAAMAELGASVPPGDAQALADRIIELALDAPRRARLAELGRARARTRTWAATGSTYRRGFAEVARMR